MSPTKRMTTRAKAYFMRRLKDDLRDRVRMVATLRNTSMEQVMNEAIEAGLPALEKVALASARKELKS